MKCGPAAGTATTAPTGSTSNLTLAEFTRRNSVPVQTFSIALGQDQTVATSGGASFTFPANLFKLPGGVPAGGTAQIRIREVYSVPDMVLTDMPTTIVQSATLLVSGGEFNVQVSQQGTRLRLAPD